MREATYYVAVSLDGYIADPTGNWSAFPMEGDHMQALMTEFTDTIPGHVQRLVGIEADRSRFDTVLMGWRTYTPALDDGIDSPYPHLRQVVASSQERTLPDEIEQTTDPLGTLRALKAEDGGSGIYVAGGGALASAVEPELDRLILKVNPITLGDGIPLFAPRSGPAVAWTRLQSRPFESGVVLNEYVRAA
ncbi:MAG: dihydrofolate reductase family protein [Solirubrobacteraceae bacterium]|nr:dihydrofolate reductase family protein [Solirubrobacteraceae bacterium]